MSAAPREIRIGAELASAPYLLDAAAAKAYHDGIELPPRRRPPRGIHDDTDAARKAGFTAPIAGVIDVFGLEHPLLQRHASFIDHRKKDSIDAGFRHRQRDLF